MRVKKLFHNYRQSFHLRILAALILIILIFIPGTGYVGYLQALKIAENQMEQYAVSTAAQISKKVHSFLAQHTYNAKLLASFFENRLITTTNQKELIQYFQLFRKDHPEFVNIYYGDQRGNFTMVPPQRPEVHKIFDPRKRPWYKGAARQGTIHWTGVYLFASTQKPGITVSSPVYNPQQELRGVCGIDIDLIAFSRFLQGIDIGKDGVAYIFENNTGHLIAHPWLSALPTSNNKLELLRSCRSQLLAKKNSFGLTTFNNKQYFTAYSPYPDKDWTVGVTLSTADYQQRIQVIKQTTITLIVVGILLSLLLSFLLARNIIRPLHHLQQAIDRIASGDLEHRVSIQDPDIARDLSKSFNKMALSLKQSLQELKSTYAELQEKEKLAAVGKMTAGIAHEIKNPLGIILGSTQVVLDKQRPWEMREKAASFIMDEVMRLDSTLKDFLAFAKPADPVFSEVNVVTLLQETLSATHERYLEDGYTIVTDFPGSVPLIEADPAQLRQIFLNVCLNGFQAMPDGGTLKIAVRAEKEPDIVEAKKPFISIRNPFTVERDWLIVSIGDEGFGIEKDQLLKIMEPFVSFRDDGVGLGLSIVTQLVKLHRGHIRIKSEPGSGTCFYIYFPCILKEHYLDV